MWASPDHRFFDPTSLYPSSLARRPRLSTPSQHGSITAQPEGDGSMEQRNPRLATNVRSGGLAAWCMRAGAWQRCGGREPVFAHRERSCARSGAPGGQHIREGEWSVPCSCSVWSATAIKVHAHLERLFRFPQTRKAKRSQAVTFVAYVFVRVGGGLFQCLFDGNALPAPIIS